ncbi:MAG: tetratricopeptide repeat protein [candidate division KSB1 bacterium]
MRKQEDLFVLAEQLWAEGEFQKALRVYRRILQDDSISRMARAIVCEYIGRLLIGVGKLMLGEKYLRQAIALEPEGLDHYVQLANCLCLLEKNDEAWEMIQELYARHPEEPALVHYMGKMLDERGEPERGLELMKTAIKLDPHNARFLADLAFAYMARGNSGAAMICSEEALALNPQDEVVRFMHNVATEFEQQEAVKFRKTSPEGAPSSALKRRKNLKASQL